MAKTYDQAPDEVRDRVMTLMKRFHPDLLKVKLRVDLLMASNDTEGAHAVTHGGYPALAMVRIVGAKERAKDVGDAEITIDRDAYEAMDGAARDALLDHELYHLALVLDKNDQPKRDGHGRPKLKMRKHDRQFGWFDEIARRHREHSHEVKQATEMFEEAAQLYFGFADHKDFMARMDAALNYSVRVPRLGIGVKIDKDGISPIAATAAA
jgi:hypothetical protein